MVGTMGNSFAVRNCGGEICGLRIYNISDKGALKHDEPWAVLNRAAPKDHYEEMALVSLTSAFAGTLAVGLDRGGGVKLYNLTNATAVKNDEPWAHIAKGNNYV